MSTMIEDRTSPRMRAAAAGMVLAAWDGIARGLGRLRRAWEIRQASAAMWNMPADMLRDIGIETCEIDWAVRHGRPERRFTPSRFDAGQ